MSIILWILAAIILGAAAWLGWNYRLTQKTAANVAQAVPPRGKFIQISSGRVHYIDKGAGPVVLMIHGLGAAAGQFRYRAGGRSGPRSPRHRD